MLEKEIVHQKIIYDKKYKSNRGCMGLVMRYNLDTNYSQYINYTATKNYHVVINNNLQIITVII